MLILPCSKQGPRRYGPILTLLTDDVSVYSLFAYTTLFSRDLLFAHAYSLHICIYLPQFRVAHTVVS